jgi:hypothetical protein
MHLFKGVGVLEELVVAKVMKAVDTTEIFGVDSHRVQVREV